MDRLDHIASSRPAGVPVLSPGFVDRDRGGVRKIEGPAGRLHGDPHLEVDVRIVDDLVGQPRGFPAEQEDVAGLVGDVREAVLRVRGEGDDAAARPASPTRLPGSGGRSRARGRGNRDRLAAASRRRGRSPGARRGADALRSRPQDGLRCRCCRGSRSVEDDAQVLHKSFSLLTSPRGRRRGPWGSGNSGPFGLSIDHDAQFDDRISAVERTSMSVPPSTVSAQQQIGEPTRDDGVADPRWIPWRMR